MAGGDGGYRTAADDLGGVAEDFVRGATTRVRPYESDGSVGLEEGAGAVHEHIGGAG